MTSAQAQEAGRAIHSCWQAGSVISALPDACRPRSLHSGYAAQMAFVEHSGETVVGWKIAATSRAGQQHINVDGPIAGRLLKSRVHANRAVLQLGTNRMEVAEAEFAFVLGDPLPARENAYSADEALAAIASVHPAIEVPDSRFADFVQAGGPQLVADNACASHFVLGPAAEADPKTIDFVSHPVKLLVDSQEVTSGTGADALGDPRAALAWIANNHALQGAALQSGDIVTTGVCGQPSSIKPGNRVIADFGVLGTAEATFS